jgi:hypothetical protein
MPFKPIYRCFLWLLLINCFNTTVSAQYFDITGHKKKVIIPFQLVRNLVIIKLKINDKGPFNFIMDTGAGLMIITDPTLVDSINIPTKRILKLSGCGDGGDYDAWVTSVLKVDIPGLTSYQVEAAILKTDHFGLSNLLACPSMGCWATIFLPTWP